MKIESIDQLDQFWPELSKGEAAASVATIKEAITHFSAQYIADLEAQKNLVKAAEAAKAENEKRANELAASLAEVRKELDEVRASQEEAEAQTKFNERMSAFDEEFELDDEDRKIIASDITGLDDEAFAAYMSKSKKLMSGKCKAGKKPFEKKDEKKEDKKEESDASVVAAKEAIASVKENAGQSTITTGVTVDENLVNSIASAFAQSMKIDGKPIVEAKK